MTPDDVMARVATVVPAAEAVAAELVRGQAVVVVPRAQLTEALRLLRDDPELSFTVLADLTVVDYLGREPRFEVVYQLRSLARGHRLRVKVGLPGDDPTVASASSLWNSALWAEREAWDLFGVRFVGHPDLRRILMYPEFEGHPLRKDYPVNKRQVLVPERDPIKRPWYPKREEG